MPCDISTPIRNESDKPVSKGGWLEKLMIRWWQVHSDVGEDDLLQSTINPTLDNVYLLIKQMLVTCNFFTAI